MIWLYLPNLPAPVVDLVEGGYYALYQLGDNSLILVTDTGIIYAVSQTGTVTDTITGDLASMDVSSIVMPQRTPPTPVPQPPEPDSVVPTHWERFRTRGG